MSNESIIAALMGGEIPPEMVRMFLDTIKKDEKPNPVVVPILLSSINKRKKGV